MIDQFPAVRPFVGLPPLTWRPISKSDLPALTILANRCLQADGGLPFLFIPEVLEQLYFPEESDVSLSAFDQDDHMIACAVVYPSTSLPQSNVLGLVHPDSRNRGIGIYLMHWSLDQASQLLTGDPEGSHVIQIRTECLSPVADHLYQRFGFNSVFEELVMRIDLNQPPPVRAFPEGVTIASWEPDIGKDFYRAYHAAFKERPGFPGWSEAEWIEQVLDNDFNPEWSLLACVEGQPAGFVIGNIDLTTDPPGCHIWQTGVVPDQRRRGICSALLAETLRRARSEGASYAHILVHTNNPSAAATYLRLGFTISGRRARYRSSILLHESKAKGETG